MKLVIKSALLLISITLSGLTASAEEQRSCEDIMAEGYTHGIQMLGKTVKQSKGFRSFLKKEEERKPF